MKILVLTKRQYMGKDTIDELYGRLRFFPFELAKQGHEVLALCLSYDTKPEETFIDHILGSDRFVTWQSFNAGSVMPAGFLRYALKAMKLAKKFQPDVIMPFSDTFYVIFGSWLARKLNVPCLADLYDNFEYFASARIPGVLPLYYQAIRNSDGVSTTSETLRERVMGHYPPKGEVRTFESGTDLSMFQPQPKPFCRAKLNLPSTGKIIGYAGAIHSNRGIDLLFRAFEQIKAQHEDCFLALSGPLDGKVQIPKDDRILYLGQLPWKDVPVFLNACDVVTIIHKDTLLGRYCFPQKTYEIVACQVPFVASRVGALSKFLKEYPDLLFDNGSADSCARAIEKQLTTPQIPDVRIRTWAELGEGLGEFLESLQKTAGN